MPVPYSICDITPGNIREETAFCIKNTKSHGFQQKEHWFTLRYQEGLRMHILKDPEDQMAGFIEYVPGQKAWRPVKANNYMFIHCLFVYPKKNKNKGYGTALIEKAETTARKQGFSGLCAMTSKGSWMSDSRLYKNLGFSICGRKGRFELVCKKWDKKVPDPELRDWELEQSNYKGWQLVYADQCPWHDKAVNALWNTAQDYDIELQLVRLQTAEEAQSAPSGFGVFSLLHNGKLLEDHYISATRFKNILKQELAIP